MKIKKHILIYLLLLICLLPNTICAQTGEMQVDNKPLILWINGNQITDGEAIQKGDQLLVSVISTFNHLGAIMTWKENEQRMYIELKGKLIVVEVNHTDVWIDGVDKKLEVMPQMVDGYLMVPSTLLQELGYQVVYIEELGTLYISDIVEEMPPVEQKISLMDQLSYLQYDTVSKSLIIAQELDTNSIEVQDNYYKRQLIFNISGNDATYFNEGICLEDLGEIKGITVTKTEQGAQMIVDTQTVCAVDISSQDGQTVFKFMKPKEKYNKVIVLDPGHGGDDSGTSYESIYEKNLTLSYAKALFELLDQDPNIKVYTTRLEDKYATEDKGTLGKQYPTKAMRVQLANEIEPDLYISIHVNWWRVNSISGTETYYFPDPQDLRGKQFANQVQQAMVNGFNMKSRGIKEGSDLVVLRDTNSPAILIETGFISNEGDRSKLIAAEYGSKFADIIYQCILSYYEKNSYSYSNK